MERMERCSLCSGKESLENLVKCLACNARVHPKCMGQQWSPTASWFCPRCAPDCDLCPSFSQAVYLKTENSRWVHELCARYMPGTRFSNIRPDLILLKYVSKACYHKFCYVCEEKGERDKAREGAAIRCKHLHCQRWFHVSCGLKKGLLFEDRKYYCHSHANGKGSPIPFDSTAKPRRGHKRSADSSERHHEVLTHPKDQISSLKVFRSSPYSKDLASSGCSAVKSFRGSQVNLKTSSSSLTYDQESASSKVHVIKEVARKINEERDASKRMNEKEMELKLQQLNTEMKGHLLEEKRLKTENDTLKGKVISMNAEIKQLEERLRQESEKRKVEEEEGMKDMRAAEESEATKDLIRIDVKEKKDLILTQIKKSSAELESKISIIMEGNSIHPQDEEMRYMKEGMTEEMYSPCRRSPRTVSSDNSLVTGFQQTRDDDNASGDVKKKSNFLIIDEGVIMY